MERVDDGDMEQSKEKISLVTVGSVATLARLIKAAGHNDIRFFHHPVALFEIETL